MTRSILEITGADTDHFLQGLITNDLEKMGDGLLYTAILTPQGKYLADFLLHRRDGTVLLDVDGEMAPGLMQRLTMYKLRADVTIRETALHVRLGWRLYGEESGDDGSDFDAIRVAHCIPETGIELTPDTFILEARFEDLNGVDFRKGCYVGQEVTARMKHKTELRKGLALVTMDGAAPVGSAITAGGKPAGTLYTQSGGHGIAYLRFDRAKGEMQAGDAILRRAE